MKMVGLGDNVMDAYLYQNKLYPGGNSVNVPVLAKRFGAAQAGYLGILANDLPGTHFLASLQEEGLDVSRVRVASGRTAMNHITLDETGDRHFTGNNGIDCVQFMLDLKLNQDDFDYLENFSLVHTSVHSFLELLLPSVGRRAPISMDFSDGYTPRNILQLAPMLSFAFLSGGDKDEEEVRRLAQYTLDCGARTVVVTSGVRGSYVLEKGRSHRQQSVPAQVVDALGAGDSYIGAFLTQYHDNGGDIADAAQKASEFAALCCGHFGAFGHAMDYSAAIAE